MVVWSFAENKKAFSTESVNKKSQGKGWVVVKEFARITWQLSEMKEKGFRILLDRFNLEK